MRLDELKHDFPETPDFIHKMVVDEVHKQLKICAQKEHAGKKGHWTFGRAAAVIAAACLAASTVVLAGVRLYHLHTEQQGDYGVNTVISAESDTEEEFILPDELPEVEIHLGYIPEGMIWGDEVHLVYENSSVVGGFSFNTLLLDEESIDIKKMDLNVVESEETTFGQHDGVYLRRNALDETNLFTQIMYLLFPEEYRIVEIYIGSDVSREEAYKVAENITLEETGDMIDTELFYTWSAYVNEMQKPAEVEASWDMTSVKADQLKLYDIGETFTIRASGEDADGNAGFSDISVTVDEVQVADDLSLLEADKIPEEWKNIVDEEGRLIQNERSYVKAGDGIDALDEVVKTDTVNQKLVYATLTYTNTSGAAIRHLLYTGSIMLIEEADGEYRCINYSNISGKDYDYVVWTGAANPFVMCYASIFEDYGNGGNYIPSLEPGESVQLSLAWIVNEDELPHMFLDVTNIGSVFFNESVLETGLVDIRQ